MSELIVRSPVIDEPVEDRVYEQRRLREFNSRLRRLFEAEQANNRDLSRALGAIQNAMDGSARALVALEKKYDESLDLLAKERVKEARVTTVDPIQSQPLNDEKTVLNAHEQAERNIADMIRKKIDKADALERKLSELVSSGNSMNALRVDVVSQGERHIANWERLIGENAAKEAECDKLDTLTAKATLERDFLADKMEHYGDKGVDAYFDKLFSTSVDQGGKALESKYKALHAEHVDKIIKEFEDKLQDAKKSLDAAAGQRLRLEEECKAAAEAINDGTQRAADIQRMMQQAEQQIGQMEEDMRNTGREIQAALAMLKSNMEEESNARVQLEQCNANIRNLEHKLRSQQQELESLLKQKEDKDRQVSKELAAIQAEREKLLAHLEGSRIFVGPEIDKYETLLEVAEVNFGSPRPAKKARHQ